MSNQHSSDNELIGAKNIETKDELQRLRTRIAELEKAGDKLHAIVAGWGASQTYAAKEWRKAKGQQP